VWAGEEEGVKWFKKGEATSYLGFPFGCSISKEEEKKIT
jgi:hypothetical protein